MGFGVSRSNTKMKYPQDNTLVQTNIGPAYRHKGAWFIWDLHNGYGSHHKYPHPERFQHWEPLVQESWMKLPTVEHFALRERLSASNMMGIDERMRLPQKVGWFRPIYYYLPIMGSMVAIAISLFLAERLDSAFCVAFAICWLPFIALQFFTAKRQYDDWVFNWKMLQVSEELSGAIAFASQLVRDESWRNEDQTDQAATCTSPTKASA